MIEAALQQTLASAGERRRQLLARQAESEAAGRDCSRCAGTCCTFVANSMQVTPREALEVTAYLLAAPGGLAVWVEPLRETVRRFALDRPPAGDGRRAFGRRRYTCTFFAGGRLGCALPRAVKPTGCLAFNPRRAGLTDGGACGTPADLTDADAGPLPPELAALVPWDRLPIPLALLETWRALELVVT